MNRRNFLSTCAAGVVACESTGLAADQKGPSTRRGAPTPSTKANTLTNSGMQRIVLRAVGLNAFIETATTVHVAALDPKDVEIYTTGHKLHAHTPKLAIAYDHLDVAPGGETPETKEVDGWKLRTSTKNFRTWSLRGQTFAIANATGPDLEANVFGAMPLRRLAQRSIDGWESQKVVAARLELKSGIITDDLPRKYDKGTHERFWRFSTGDFECGAGYPVQLTDTLRIELEADAAFPLTFTVGSNVIKTKGTFVEAYLLSLPDMISEFEEKNWFQLFHTLGGYELFDDPPESKPIPKTDSGGISSEPIFCPPSFYSRK
jgi:hypothetical protein